MEYLQILESIEELTVEEVEHPKLKLEDLELIHRSLTLDNPLTYKVFLAKRDDLPEDEKDIILQIIKRLENNEKVKYEHALKVMHEFKAFEDIQDNKVIKPLEELYPDGIHGTIEKLQN